MAGTQELGSCLFVLLVLILVGTRSMKPRVDHLRLISISQLLSIYSDVGDVVLQGIRPLAFSLGCKCRQRQQKAFKLRRLPWVRTTHLLSWLETHVKCSTCSFLEQPAGAQEAASCSYTVKS